VDVAVEHHVEHPVLEDVADEAHLLLVKCARIEAGVVEHHNFHVASRAAGRGPASAEVRIRPSTQTFESKRQCGLP
jgi:hypothetical protein